MILDFFTGTLAAMAKDARPSLQSNIAAKAAFCYH